MDDLVKLKCDYFDKNVAYDPCDPGMICPYFLSNEIGIYYAESPQETELEDGIYYKGFKVSDL